MAQVILTPRPGPFHKYMMEEETKLRPSLRCNARNMEELRKWQELARTRLSELLGQLPKEKVPLNIKMLEEVDRGAYIQKKIKFDVEGNFSIPAYLLAPKGLKRDGSNPSLLCLHGHGNGKIDLLGPRRGDKFHIAWVKSLNYDYAKRFAEDGFLVLAPDARGFGELGDLNCTQAYTVATLLGKTVVGLRVWDAMCAVDLLQSLPEVDPDRIGAAGLSWGGTHTSYLTMLDTRVKVAVVSGYFSTFRDILVDVPQCPCQYTPRIRMYFDFPNLLIGLVAPRPLLIQNGDVDPYFHTVTVKRAYKRESEIYRAIGVPEHIKMHLFKGGHTFMYDEARKWVLRWL